MKTFRIYFTETNVGYVYIKAASKEEAKNKFNDNNIEDLNPRYIDGSVDVDSITEEE